MQAAEIALRQEIRQMLNEAGINKTTLREMAESIMQEEIEKQVKNAVSQTNMNRIIHDKFCSYGLNDVIQDTIRKVITESMDIHININAVVDQKEKTE